MVHGIVYIVGMLYRSAPTDDIGQSVTYFSNRMHNY
jgi:hypothetical protein